MRFFTQQHAYYCGIDLHAKTMYLCILNQAGDVLLHRNIKSDPEAFLHVIASYRTDLVVCVECIFTWYWIADLCARENLPFVLGHALYMKAIHGGKTKNDRIDAAKIAHLLRGGYIPMAYVYPTAMRATRDLLRRRMHLMRQRAQLLAHIRNTNSQYNLPPIGRKIAYKANREGVADHFPDEAVRQSMEVNLQLIDFYDPLLTQLELNWVSTAKIHDPQAFHLLRSIRGVGKILALVLLYEIHDIHRFPRVQNFCSYCRLIQGAHQSAGKTYCHSGKEIGNAHWKWAFSAAAALLIRCCPAVQKYKPKNLPSSPTNWDAVPTTYSNESSRLTKNACYPVE